jgi:serine/threonine-protein kinase
LTSGGDKESTQVSPEPSVVAVTGKCVVSYTVWSEQSGRFKASVSVANRDSSAISNWKLWFLMPGDQVMSGNGVERLDQQDGAVTVTSKQALPPQATKTMQITGRYKESNAAPMVFQLDGQTCETYVSGKPGAPSQPVEHLTDGTTRLGPVATSNTPVPGLSTKPNGVVVPVPVTSSSASTTPTPSTSVSTSASPSTSSTPTKSDGPPPSLPPTDPTTPPTTAATTTTPPTPPPVISINPEE